MRKDGSIELFHKLMETYRALCKPLCREVKLPQTAFDILMFLANNPEYKTAKDITVIRGICANLVSVNVEKLVREGYLERNAAPDDRRKVLLFCTEKARPVVEKGRRIQEEFFRELYAGIDKKSQEEFCRILKQIEMNINRLAGN